jgi:hypothetical protein
MKDTNSSSLLDAYLGGFAQGVGGEGRTEALLWHMDSPHKRLQKLLKNEAYFKQLVKLLQNCRGYEAYFITDIITLIQAANISDELHDGTVQGISNLLPLPHELHTHNRTQELKHESQYVEGETILFLGYSRIRLERSSRVFAKLARVFLGKRHGVTVRDESDYWPQEVQRPATENVNTFLGSASEGTTDMVGGQSVPALDEHTAMAGELGFYVEIIG